jgi:hypothetical protein
MTALATDNFNRADSAGDMGANWNVLVGGVSQELDIVSNTTGNLGGPMGGYYNAVSGPANGYVQVKITTVVTVPTDGQGVVFRHGAGGYYGGFLNSGFCELVTWDATNSYVIKGTITTPFANGDIFKVTFLGNAFEFFRNGSSLGKINDSTFTSGNCGLWSADSAGTGFMDDFEFGTIDNFVTNTGSGGVTFASDDVGPGLHYPRNKAVVGPDATAQEGWTAYKLNSAASTNATSVKASAAKLGFAAITNTNASACYFKLYNKASAPTVGSDTPVQVYCVPGNTAGTGSFVQIDEGLTFSTGLAFAITTGAADSNTGAVAANEVVVNLGYA